MEATGKAEASSVLYPLKQGHAWPTEAGAAGALDHRLISVLGTYRGPCEKPLAKLRESAHRAQCHTATGGVCPDPALPAATLQTPRHFRWRWEEEPLTGWMGR